MLQFLPLPVLVNDSRSYLILIHKYLYPVHSGAFYLAYEGVEKIVDYLFHTKRKPTLNNEQVHDNGADSEEATVKAAITTDFISRRIGFGWGHQ